MEHLGGVAGGVAASDRPEGWARLRMVGLLRERGKVCLGAVVSHGLE